MKPIDLAKFQLTVCAKCFGCNKLEDEEFKGVMYCKDYRTGTNERSMGV